MGVSVGKKARREVDPDFKVLGGGGASAILRPVPWSWGSQASRVPLGEAARRPRAALWARGGRAPTGRRGCGRPPNVQPDGGTQVFLNYLCRRHRSAGGCARTPRQPCRPARAASGSPAGRLCSRKLHLRGLPSPHPSLVKSDRGYLKNQPNS